MQKPLERTVPKLGLPDHIQPFEHLPDRNTDRRKSTEASKQGSDNVTVLKIEHCSTALNEADFRRLVPQGKHIEGWVQDGDIAQVIPGRDPLTLARLPFYWLVFPTHDGAVAYYMHVHRVHSLARVHTPRSIFSAVPPPPGLIEDGEELHTLIQNYSLYPPTLDLSLSIVKPPYDPLVHTVIEQGGYWPIVDNKGKRSPKVLLWIEGHEPSQFSLYNSMHQDGVQRGLTWGIVGGQHGVKKVADLMNAKRRSRTSRNGSEEPEILQETIGRMYNRWVIEFQDESMARRFARAWNGRPLPIGGDNLGWRNDAAERICSTEALW